MWGRVRCSDRPVPKVEHPKGPARAGRQGGVHLDRGEAPALAHAVLERLVEHAGLGRYEVVIRRDGPRRVANAARCGDDEGLDARRTAARVAQVEYEACAHGAGERDAERQRALHVACGPERPYECGAEVDRKIAGGLSDHDSHDEGQHT
jgi:hypothetical protein